MKTTLFNRLTAGLLAAALCLSVLAGCAAKPQKELTRYSTIFYDVFDTVTQVIAYCESEEEFTKQMEALHADLISYNQLYDIYNDYDGVVNVKTINDNAGKAPVQVDDRILSMLELAQKMYDTTNGKLNVAMGSVLNIWHNYREAAESHQNEADNTLPTQEELLKLIPDYDVLIMRVDPAINKEILDAAKNLKVIGVCSVGLNHIDLDTAKEKGIQVFNAPGLNGNAVAELTLCKMLEMSRHTIPACHDVKVNKTWDKYKFVGRELRGKTLGVLGFGRIGQRVGELARVFKMDVVAYDPYLPAHVFEEQHAKSMSIEEVLKVSDYVTIHMPLNDETRNLFNAKSIAEMKDDAIVLNMARGGIVNEKDMYEALKAGKIGGYASDVMENELAAGGLTEGAGFDSPLFECDNFIVTPHLGAQTVDASRDIGAHIIGKVKEALDLK